MFLLQLFTTATVFTIHEDIQFPCDLKNLIFSWFENSLLLLSSAQRDANCIAPQNEAINYYLTIILSEMLSFNSSPACLID